MRLANCILGPFPNLDVIACFSEFNILEARIVLYFTPGVLRVRRGILSTADLRWNLDGEIFGRGRRCGAVRMLLGYLIFGEIGREITDFYNSAADYLRIICATFSFL